MDRNDERYIQYLLSLMSKSPHAEMFSRRQLLRLATGSVFGSAALAAFLAACGNSSSSTSSSSGSSSSASSSGGGASATAAASGTPAAGSGASPVTSAKLPEMSSIPANLKGSGEVRVVSWGGAFQDAQRKAYFQPFEKLSGIKVVESEGPDPAKIKAMVDTHNIEWDIAELDRGDVLNLQKQGDYFEEIDYSLVDTANIDKVFQGKWALDMLPYAQTYAYRTDAFKGAKPASWADAWDTTKFSGPRALPGGTGGTLPDLEAAIIAAGSSPQHVYPIDIDKAYDSLSKIKKSVVKWWSAGAQPAQMLANNEIVIGDAWNGRIAAIQDQGAPVEIGWNQGQLLDDAWCVPKGSPNKENAMKFIAFITLPISQARLSMLIPYGFVNDKAAEYIPAATLNRLPTAPGIKDKLFVHDSQWWADNRQAVLTKWNTWILS